MNMARRIHTRTNSMDTNDQGLLCSWHIRIYDGPEEATADPNVLYLQRPSSLSTSHMRRQQTDVYLVSKCEDWKC